VSHRAPHQPIASFFGAWATTFLLACGSPPGPAEPARATPAASASAAEPKRCTERLNRLSIRLDYLVETGRLDEALLALARTIVADPPAGGTMGDLVSGRKPAATR